MIERVIPTRSRRGPSSLARTERSFLADQPANVLRIRLMRVALAFFGFLLLWAVVIEARLVYLQVVRWCDLSARAERAVAHD